ncbi:hypothetical protein K438DRAFT_1759774 [Mycena galopus ATCC 62051]|nr:hypothetical protein K438DRAFT_1759774 [Mycena galopus ATCC 62051]
MWGAGMMHAETVEQNWEFKNGAAASTKMMGVGTRHTMLEDLFGFHNWCHLVAAHRLLPKHMAENVKEGQVHWEAFEVFNNVLKQTVLELVAKWETWVHEWESQHHRDGVFSPFELKEKATNLRDIQLKLVKEELLKSGDSGEIEQEDTPSTFLVIGVDLEETQRVLAIDIKAVANPMEAQTIQFMKRRVSLTRRLRAFRKMQCSYMPHLRRWLTAGQRTEKELHVLEDSNVRALTEQALMAEEAEQRKKVHTYGEVEEEGGVAAFGVVALGEKHRTLSWIWYMAKEGDTAMEKELVEGTCMV